MRELDLSCRLYIKPIAKTEQPKLHLGAFAAKVLSCFGRKLDEKNFGFELFSLVIETNDGYNVDCYSDNLDFMSYPFSIWIEPRDSIEDPKVFIELVSLLITSIRGDGTSVVAACDYEEKLPLPWVA